MPNYSYVNSLLSTPSSLSGSVFDLELLDDSRDGFLLFRVSGIRGADIFDGESGGHRWQRIPPTEKRGRVHTSTITVAVLTEPDTHMMTLALTDVEESFTRGSGAGGQHRQKNCTAVVLHHRPTGVRVRIESGRSRHRNRQTAMAVLSARLADRQGRTRMQRRNADRRQQVGSGMRGDKVRTVRVQADEVVDHRTGRRVSFKRYRRGDFGALLSHGRRRE